MADNILETMQRLLQDVIAPDVREIKVRVGSLEKSIDERFNGVDQRFDSLQQQNEAQFKAIMAAIAESKAQSENTALREISYLRERVAVLEAQRH